MSNSVVGRQSQSSAARKVAGSNPSAGKIFQNKLFVKKAKMKTYIAQISAMVQLASTPESTKGSFIFTRLFYYKGTLTP